MPIQPACPMLSQFDQMCNLISPTGCLFKVKDIYELLNPAYLCDPCMLIVELFKSFRLIVVLFICLNVLCSHTLHVNFKFFIGCLKTTRKQRCKSKAQLEDSDKNFPYRSEEYQSAY